jgi:hypothetical protein
MRSIMLKPPNWNIWIFHLLISRAKKWTCSKLKPTLAIIDFLTKNRTSSLILLRMLWTVTLLWMLSTLTLSNLESSILLDLGFKISKTKFSTSAPISLLPMILWES